MTLLKYRRPTQPAISRFDDLPIMGSVAGAVNRGDDPRIGMKMSRIGEPGEIRDLHRHQDR